MDHKSLVLEKHPTAEIIPFSWPGDPTTYGVRIEEEYAEYGNYLSIRELSEDDAWREEAAECGGEG